MSSSYKICFTDEDFYWNFWETCNKNKILMHDELKKYNATKLHINGVSTLLTFDTEQDYLHFLLVWS